VAIGPIRLELADPEVTLEGVTAAALNYRLDLQTRRDRLDDSRRAVANARNDALPNLDLAAGVSIPTDPDDFQGEVGFSPGDLDYNAGVTFGLPLDRTIERARIRQTIIALERAERDYDEFRDNVLVAVRTAARQIDLQRFQLTLAEQRVEIDQRRVRELELKSAEVDTQTKIDADNDLLNSLNSRDRAKTNLRNAILQYLLQSGQLRVARDGTFQPLPGMPEALEPAAPTEPGFPPEPGEIGESR
jgi:outer membrane protein TolC